MKKFIKWSLILLVVGGFLALCGVQIFKLYTKQFSPERVVTYTDAGFDLAVSYSAPYKKGRVIFGGLVPYGQVWRTGANEATTFSCDTELSIDGEELPAGEYTLWTIPDDEEWQVIFNKGDYLWGINPDGSPQYDPGQDVLTARAPVINQANSIEQFNIYFSGSADTAFLQLEWDHTRVKVPLLKAGDRSF